MDDSIKSWEGDSDSDESPERNKTHGSEESSPWSDGKPFDSMTSSGEKNWRAGLRRQQREQAQRKDGDKVSVCV